MADYNGEEDYLSADILHYFQRHLVLVDQWWVNGKHFAKMADAWLAQMSGNYGRMMALLRTSYPDEQQALIEYRKIEWYLWVSSEEYAHQEGNALGLSHYLFEKKI
jgi:hypothetical protein